MKLKQYISKLLYKSGRKVIGKVSQRKQQGEVQELCLNCTGVFTQLLRSKFNVSDYSSLLVLTCHVLTDMIQVIKDKII